MLKKEIRLDTVEKVKEFVDLTSRTELDVDLVSGRYVIDAKSLMGIFSLNLSKTIELQIHDKDEKAVSEYIKSIDKFLV